MRRNTEADFWEKVSPEPNTGCWLWTGAVDPDGYGLIKWGGRTVRATRLAWELVRGPIPEGMEVCHRCDMPSCMNVERCFFLGTSQTNQLDKVSKGRQARGGTITARRKTARGDRHGSRTHPEARPRGSRSGTARLTESKVAEIRARKTRGVTIDRLAAEYGVSAGAIQKVLYRATWRHVA